VCQSDAPGGRAGVTTTARAGHTVATVIDVQASDFVTIALLVVLEGLLSADNALVMAIMVLGLPKDQQHKALRYGLVGGFGLRIVATALAVYLIRLAWVKLLGGVYLLYLTWEHFTQSGGAEARRTPPKARPAFGLSALWATIVKVEMVNLAFSVDSILVAVAMSPKAWVVVTGGLLGIVALRLVVGQLLVVIQRYPALVDGAFVIIAWVGIKLLLEYLHTVNVVHFEIPKLFSIGLIVAIFLMAFLYARKQGPQAPKGDELEDRASDLLKSEAELLAPGEDDFTK
jgi:YkoY family integral membrane protein